MWQAPTVRQHIWSLILPILLILGVVLDKILNDYSHNSPETETNKQTKHGAAICL